MRVQRGKMSDWGYYALCWIVLLVSPGVSHAQASAAASSATRLVGTVKALGDGTLTLEPDQGNVVTVTLSSETRVLDLAPGSTDLKSAQPGSVDQIVAGDRVLITSLPTNGSATVARRIVLMRCSAIVQQRQNSQAAWAHSTGGTITALDEATGTITMSVGGRVVAVKTAPTTIFRRYADDSARFEDTTRGSFAKLRIGDQVRVRDNHSGDSQPAAEIVSGSFEQISGSIVTVDQAKSTITVRELHSKKEILIRLTTKTEVHELPPEMAARFAARSRSAGATSDRPAGTTAGGGVEPAHDDLGQAAAHLPSLSVSSLRPNESVLLLAAGDRGAPTAILVISGVEPILAAMESGGAETSLAPWSVGAADSSASQ